MALHISELRKQIDPKLFAGFRPSAFPATTLPALELAAHAYRQDPAVGEEPASFALRHALFEEGRDPSMGDVLKEIAEQVGMEDMPRDDHHHRLVFEEWHEGQRRGVEGSPHFFCKGMNSL